MYFSSERYMPRIVDKELKALLRTFGAVCIEGPKWCGKTWTALNSAKSVLYLNDPDGNFQNRKKAEMDPSSALIGELPRLIDEWQYVPSLWDAVRHEIDKSRDKGRFILTGSSTPQRKGICHSGVGRFAILRMRPMTLFESGDSNGSVSLSSILENNVEISESVPTNLGKLSGLVVRGGWPATVGMGADDAQRVSKNYLDITLREDIHKVEGTRHDWRKMGMLVKSLARNEGTTASMRALARDISEFEGDGIDRGTVSAYLDTLDRLFITDDQPAFSVNLRSPTRVGKTPKRHLADPSLAAAALGLTQKKLLGDLKTFGFLFEAMCERDLRVYAESLGGELFHYRDHDGGEIDAVVEMPDGSWGAFEIKLGANQIDEAAEKLVRFRDAMVGNGAPRPPKSLCVVCGLIDYAYTRDDGVSVVPITAMRD